MSAAANTVQTDLKALRKESEASPDNLPMVRAGFDNSQGFALAQRGAAALAASTLVPGTFQGSVPNCLIALEMAQRIGASPLMVMQHLYIVQGKPAWSAIFLIASFNQCGRFSSIRYEWLGDKGKDSYGCRAWAIEKETGEKILGAPVTWEVVKAEGWNKRSGSKWLTMPDQMFMYRAASWLVKAYAPEISMGLSTAEELGDVFDAKAGPDGAYGVTLESLRGAQATVDTTTGEITQAESTPAAIQSPEGASDWLEAIRSAGTVKALDGIWKSLPTPVPIELEAAYHDRRESLDQQKA